MPCVFIWVDTIMYEQCIHNQYQLLIAINDVTLNTYGTYIYQYDKSLKGS